MKVIIEDEFNPKTSSSINKLSSLKKSVDLIDSIKYT